MPASDCLLRLRELALEMQNHEEGRQKQVALAWAGEKLAKRFGGGEAAERFLRKEQTDSGIVVSRGREIAYWRLWRRVLFQRSQKSRKSRERLSPLLNRWIPRPRVLHPYPEQRFAARHPR